MTVGKLRVQLMRAYAWCRIPALAEKINILLAQKAEEAEQMLVTPLPAPTFEAPFFEEPPALHDPGSAANLAQAFHRTSSLWLLEGAVEISTLRRWNGSCKYPEERFAQLSARQFVFGRHVQTFSMSQGPCFGAWTSDIVGFCTQIRYVRA